MAALLLGAVVVVGCHRPAPAAPPGYRGPIVLVSFRGLGAADLELGATPALDRFRAQATWSGTAVATASWSVASLASVWTGLGPSLHGAAYPTRRRLEAGSLTLAERLSAAGFATRAVYSDAWTGPGSGLERGFAEMRPLRRRSSERLLAALPAEPSFSWIQLPLPGPEPAVEAGGAQGRRAHAPSRRKRVAGADARFARLIAALERSGREAVVLVLSDHGGEGSGASDPVNGLARERLEVPLAILLPPALASRLAAPAGAVGLDRVTATVLELAGVDAPPGLAPSLLHGAPWQALSELWFANGSHQLSLVEAGSRLLWRCRFAEPATDWESLVREGAEPGGSTGYGVAIAAQEEAFRRRPECALGQELALESWAPGDRATLRSDDDAIEAMARRLRQLVRFPPEWSVAAPLDAPRLRRRDLFALSGWGLPVPAQWAAAPGR